MTPTKDWCALTIAQTIGPLPGWCSHSKAQRLFELVVREKPIRSIELGIFGGRSLLPLALGHWHLGHGKVIGVDPWTADAALEGKNAPENDAWWSTVDLAVVEEKARETLTRLVPPEWWYIHKMSSLESAIPECHPIKYGVIHQDSNHSEEISCAELDLYLPLMQPGSLWIMDDAHWPTLQKVQKLMVEDKGFRLIEDHEDWRVYRVPA